MHLQIDKIFIMHKNTTNTNISEDYQQSSICKGELNVP